MKRSRELITAGARLKKSYKKTKQNILIINGIEIINLLIMNSKSFFLTLQAVTFAQITYANYDIDYEYLDDPLGLMKRTDPRCAALYCDAQARCVRRRDDPTGKIFCRCRLGFTGSGKDGDCKPVIPKSTTAYAYAPTMESNKYGAYPTSTTTSTRITTTQKTTTESTT